MQLNALLNFMKGVFLFIYLRKRVNDDLRLSLAIRIGNRVWINVLYHPPANEII